MGSNLATELADGLLDLDLETQMNKEKFTVDNNHKVNTELKYNTTKLSYNYRF